MEGALRLSSWSQLGVHLAAQGAYQELGPGRAEYRTTIAGVAQPLELSLHRFDDRPWLAVEVVAGSLEHAPARLDGGLAIGAFALRGDTLLLRQVLPFEALAISVLDDCIFALARLALDLTQLRTRKQVGTGPAPAHAALEQVTGLVPAALCAAVVARCAPRFARGDECYQHHGHVEVLLEPFAGVAADDPGRELEQLVAAAVRAYGARLGLRVDQPLQRRVARYGLDMSCPLHHDVFASGVQPTLSAIVNLNDDFTGGDLLFGAEATASPIVQRVGTLIVFPSTPAYPHQVTPVRAGARYSFLTWF